MKLHGGISGRGDTVAITLDADGNAVKVTVRSDDLGSGEWARSAEQFIDMRAFHWQASYTVGGEDASSEDQTYDSERCERNTVLVTNGGNLTMGGARLGKTGDTTSEDESNFYAVNAVAAATANSYDRPQ